MAVSDAFLEAKTAMEVTKAVSEDAMGEAKTAVEGTKAVSDQATVEELEDVAMGQTYDPLSSEQRSSYDA